MGRTIATHLRGGYADFRRKTPGRKIEIGELRIPVVAVEDLLVMKPLAGRLRAARGG